MPDSEGLAGLEAKLAGADLNLHSYEDCASEVKDNTAAEIKASGAPL